MITKMHPRTKATWMTVGATILRNDQKSDMLIRINETLTDIRALAVWASERIYAEGEIDDEDDDA